MRIRPAIVIGTLCLSAAMLGGCSTTTTLDYQKLEDGIATGLAEQVGDEWTVTARRASPSRRARPSRARSPARDGTTVTITVTEDDEEGNVTWETVDPPPPRPRRTD